MILLLAAKDQELKKYVHIFIFTIALSAQFLLPKLEVAQSLNS
jgi:hypothetical protein